MLEEARQMQAVDGVASESEQRRKQGQGGQEHQQDGEDAGRGQRV